MCTFPAPSQPASAPVPWCHSLPWQIKNLFLTFCCAFRYRYRGCRAEQIIILRVSDFRRSEVESVPIDGSGRSRCRCLTFASQKNCNLIGGENMRREWQLVTTHCWLMLQRSLLFPSGGITNHHECGIFVRSAQRNGSKHQQQHRRPISWPDPFRD